jgi:hypothetical protein
VEGLERVTSRDRDADLMTALGRIEASRLDRELPDLPAVSSAADSDADNFLVGGVSWSYSLVNPQDEPLVDYQIGDLLSIHDPPAVDGEGRLMDITVVMNPESIEYTVVFEPPRSVVGS